MRTDLTTNEIWRRVFNATNRVLSNKLEDTTTVTYVATYSATVTYTFRTTYTPVQLPRYTNEN